MPCLLSKLLFQENTLKGSKTLNMKSLFPRGRSLIEKEFKSLDLPGGSEGKESACNAGDPGSIPGSGKFPWEGHGTPLQYFCLENSVDRRAWWTVVHGVARSDRTEQLTLRVPIPLEFSRFGLKGWGKSGLACTGLFLPFWPSDPDQCRNL